MRIERTPLVAVDPFNLEDVKDRARITDSDSDFELTLLAKSAARELEQYASIALLNQTIKVTLDEWGCENWFSLPVAPLAAGAPIALTIGGTAVTAVSVVYGSRPAMRLTDTSIEGEVIISYTAGFGPTATSIPQDLRQAIHDQVVAAYDLRGEAEAKGNGMSPHMARIAARYRRVAL